AVFMPASGWIGDRFGAKRTFLAAVTLFTAASALCGTAGSLEALVAFRVLQGVGGGLLVPVGMAMLFRAYPQAERARASRLLLVPTACAPAIGPILGGVLVDGVGWHWIFLVNVPIGVATVLFGALLLEDGRSRPVGRLDLAGLVRPGGGLARVGYRPHPGAPAAWGSRPSRRPAGPGWSRSPRSSSSSCAPTSRCSTCACWATGCSARSTPGCSPASAPSSASSTSCRSSCRTCEASPPPG